MKGIALMHFTMGPEAAKRSQVVLWWQQGGIASQELHTEIKPQM